MRNLKRKLASVVLAIGASAGTAYAAGVELDAATIDAAFAKIDPDNDGTVDWKEAQKFGLTKTAFTKANPDNDGTLDKKEFAVALKMQFDAANPDNDGTLDWKEAQKAGVKSKATFDAANPDKDGTLDLKEYLAAMLAQMK